MDDVVDAHAQKLVPAGDGPPEELEPEGPPERLRRRFSMDDPGVQAAIEAAEERDRKRRNGVEAPRAYAVRFMCKPTEFESIKRILCAREVWDRRYRELPANKVRQEKRLPGMEGEEWIKE